MDIIEIIIRLLEKTMGKHTYFGHNRRVTMINHLKSLLDYHEESYSNSEIYSYSNKPLCIFNTMFF